MLENFRSQKIIWDRANKTIFEKIEANSGDSNGRKLVVQVINQGVTENLSGTTLSLGWKYRNSAKGLDAFDVVDASKGIFEIYYTTEMLSNIGNIGASLILTDSTGRIESSTFTISITPSTVDDESVESENSFTALTEALVKVNDLEGNYAPRLNEVTEQLANKVGDGVKAEPEDLSATTLGLVTGMGGPINILSIPQDKSVTYNKTDFLTSYYTNLIDKGKIVEGYLSATGSLANHTLTRLTDFIPVQYGKTYIAEIWDSTSGWASWYYNANKEPIKKITKNADGSFTVDDTSIAFVRLVIYKTTITDQDLMMVEGTTYPLEYIPHELTLTPSKPLENMIKSYVQVEGEENGINVFRQELVNMIDPSKMSSGFIDATTGKLSTGASFMATDFIPVTEGLGYIGNHIDYNWGVYYKPDKTFHSAMISKFKYFEPPTGAAFVRLTYLSSATEKKYLIEGTTPPNPIPDYGDVRLSFTSEDYRKDVQKELLRSDLYGMTWNALGDSITDAPDKSRNYHSIVGSEMGLFVRNYGVSGTRISLGTGGTAGTEMATRYSEMNDDADIITVFGGINDMNNSLPLGTMADRTVETFYGALHILLSGLHKKYLGKRLGFISPINYGSAAHIPYQAAIRDVCKYYSIPLLDLSEDGLINTVIPDIKTAFIPDGLHPNEAGHDVLARKIKQFLLSL